MNTTTSLLHRSTRITTFPTPTPTPNTMPSALNSRSRSSSIDSFDEEYFDKTYVPLSNLPTPPLSSHSNASSRQQSPEALFAPTEYLNPEFLGPAIHLTNLVPTSVSLTSPSTSLIHALLTRAALPYETIALAVCILDSLNSRFALSFRHSFPLAQPHAATSTSPSNENTNQHIDSIHPEIIPLAALILSVKFLDDTQQTTRYYVQQWARSMWTCAQLNYAQWCLMDNLGGRLLPLWDEDVILGALRDMERAGRTAVKIHDGNEYLTCRRKGMSDGKAVLGSHHQLTPGESPLLVAYDEEMVELGNRTGEKLLPLL